MKILLIVDDYLPSSIKVAAKMMHELGVYYVKQGYEVTVITPENSLNRSYIDEVLDGVRVLRFRSGEIKNVGMVKRAINELFLSYRAFMALKAVLKNDKHDLIVYYSPSIFFGPLVGKLKKLWKVPSYLVLRDFFPQWVIDQGILSRFSPITLFFRFFERWNYCVADTIGIMSPKNLAWFETHTKTDKPLQVLYNWAENRPVEAENKHKKALGLEEKIVFFYGGNIGYAQDMGNIVRLAKNLESYPKAHFVLVGSGDEVPLIEDAIKKGSINITYLPSVDQTTFKSMLAEFDIGLFTLHKNHKTHNFPGKLLGYMVQRKPILGSINPDNDLEEVLENAEAGLITINGENQQFLNNAIKLLEDKLLREKMGNNASKLLEAQFSVASIGEQIVKSSLDV